MRFYLICLWMVIVGSTHLGVAADDGLDRAVAEKALHQAVNFFRKQVATNGSYLWRYSADLKHGEGEGRALSTTAWVQPPGTPTVGEAYLSAYQLTEDPIYLNAAVETALGLTKGQLESGGWDYRIEFREQRKKYRYRLDQDRPAARNVTTLDDDVTQSALRFLMRVDMSTEFDNQQIHDAAMYALKRLEQAQYPNGAWPQRFSEPPDAEKFPVQAATYPDTWPREHPKVDYRSFYTFNDNTIADMIDTFFVASAIYEDPHYQVIAEKAGGFILLAQMPEPQPAWAQQYDARMQPAWARRFEPAAVTGGESQGVMRTLLKLYEWTGDTQYLEPIPRAVAYLKRSQLPDGRLARFYELQTNEPLYFTTKYELTYKDDDLPTHYGFKVSSSLDSIEAAYKRIKDAPPRKLKVRSTRTVKLTPSLTRQARAVIDAMDQRGAWVEEGQLLTVKSDSRQIIESRTFAKNVEILARFIAARP
jgi:PelA/Pel-15E family pectate lyase